MSDAGDATAADAATAGNGAGNWATPSEPVAAGAPAPADALGSLVAERPEVAVGAAFLGGLIAARIIKRLGR